MFDKAKAVENAMRQNVKVDELIAKLHDMKRARIKSAMESDLWFLVEEYQAARIAVDVFGQDDLNQFMQDCSGDLYREHLFDIEEDRQLTRKEVEL